MVADFALIAMMMAAPAGTPASEESSARCADISEPKAVVVAHHGRWTELGSNQWQFLRGIYAMNPDTPPGLPFGSHAVLARFDGRPDGIVFFIDGNMACTPMFASSELMSMLDDIAANTIKHEAAGL